MYHKHFFFAFFIIISIVHPTAMQCMDGTMPALIPWNDQESKQVIAQETLLKPPRTVPSLVMCCLKQACLARLEKESKESTFKRIILFQSTHKKDAWLAVYAQISTKLGDPTSTEESPDLLTYRWRNAYQQYNSRHNDKQLYLADKVGHYKDWNNEDDFLHYFDELINNVNNLKASPQIWCGAYSKDFELVYRAAIWNHAPQAVYTKLAAFGVNLYQGDYLDEAVKVNNIPYVQHLLQHGGLSLADSKMPHGLLHYIASRRELSHDHEVNSYAMTQVLLHYGADIHQKNAHDLTPADVACLHNKKDIAEFLDAHEEATNKKMFGIIPDQCGGIEIPQGTSEYQKRKHRRSNALQKKCAIDDYSEPERPCLIQ